MVFLYSLENSLSGCATKNRPAILFKHYLLIYVSCLLYFDCVIFPTFNSKHKLSHIVENTWHESCVTFHHNLWLLSKTTHHIDFCSYLSLKNGRGYLPLPANKNLFTGGPPANKKLFAGGPPANKNLFARTPSVLCSSEWSCTALFSLPLYYMVLYGFVRFS